ncbi:unnamed protein product [Spirodela intermedia]|uniref:Uncharacterized protein n=1 Tax=Spirodela intermedia TaxID=51605 RepID=A0A7I8KA02_SPIIN|nr:unnamed protein product [Spirodela intermedia]
MVSLPHNCQPIRLKWIYKAKRNPYGEIIKHKNFILKGYNNNDYGGDT